MFERHARTIDTDFIRANYKKNTRQKKTRAKDSETL